MDGITAAVSAVVSKVPTLCSIGGKWVVSTDGKTFPVEDPGTGEIIAQVADASRENALQALSAACDSAEEWAGVAPLVRSEILRKAFNLTINNTDFLATLMVAEGGKTLADAKAEVTYGAEFLRWYAGEALHIGGEFSKSPAGDKRILVMHQPIGVSLLITPWNFPLAMVTRKVAPALAAGCTVILKPAEETPLTALFMSKLFYDAGLPRGVLNVLPTSDPGKIVDLLLADPRVRKLSFTGSTEVGRMLLAKAAPGIVNCSMELGGNGAFILLNDADIDKAVDGAMTAKMRNGGQACTAANRFFVHESIEKEFTDKLAQAMSGLKMAHGLQPGTQVGPLINQSAFQKVTRLVDGAIDDGADPRGDIDVSLSCASGYFYPPTVLGKVPRHSRILSEEIFGPVAPIVSFKDIKEVVTLANNSMQGLVSYVYSTDLTKALKVAEALECGMVGINRGLVSDPAAPFGGLKQSGIGREGGHEGMLEFLETKYVALDW
ncbi:MAG: NAD-dependent succinate-semialdehyde dehydrogenase [Actinobacteria bacterium]|nr:NAD-dependent succinate-semialdehyde dehydrogenase [Actinomycetota bacterium]MCL6104525.1 NAD-dependent succinate-semialdehyde dehydrogenase [Actinomycetota bacterium]